jgi:hypothetical protein
MSFRLQVATLGLLLASALGAQAVLPQPMCIYYGQAKDEFGWPYSGSHQGDVILRIGTNEITRHHVSGSLSPGVNFALYRSTTAADRPTCSMRRSRA